MAALQPSCISLIHGGSFFVSVGALQASVFVNVLRNDVVSENAKRVYISLTSLVGWNLGNYFGQGLDVAI
jgi:hypothetical protein